MSIKRGFIVIMSNKERIQIEDYEYRKLELARKSGSVFRSKQGEIYPNQISCVIEDKERMSNFYEKANYDLQMLDGDNRDKRKKMWIDRGLQPLKDIFKETLEKYPELDFDNEGKVIQIPNSRKGNNLLT